MIETLKEYQGWPNLDGATTAGAGPHEWAAYLTCWQRGHEDKGTILPGVKEEVRRRFESVAAVIIDDHSGLVSKSCQYIG